MDDTFVVWPHDLDRLQNFFKQLDSLRTSVHFTIEIKSYGILPFLDGLVTKKGLVLATKVYRKPTDTDCYLHFELNHSPSLKRRIIKGLHSTVSTIFQCQQDLLHEYDIPRQDFNSVVTHHGLLTQFLSQGVTVI